MSIESLNQLHDESDYRLVPMEPSSWRRFADRVGTAIYDRLPSSIGKRFFLQQSELLDLSVSNPTHRISQEADPRSEEEKFLESSTGFTVNQIVQNRQFENESERQLWIQQKAEIINKLLRFQVENRTSSESSDEQKLSELAARKLAALLPMELSTHSKITDEERAAAHMVFFDLEQKTDKDYELIGESTKSSLAQIKEAGIDTVRTATLSRSLNGLRTWYSNIELLKKYYLYEDSMGIIEVQKAVAQIRKGMMETHGITKEDEEIAEQQTESSLNLQIHELESGLIDRFKRAGVNLKQTRQRFGEHLRRHPQRWKNLAVVGFAAFTIASCSDRNPSQYNSDSGAQNSPVIGNTEPPRVAWSGVVVEEDPNWIERQWNRLNNLWDGVDEDIVEPSATEIADEIKEFQEEVVEPVTTVIVKEVEGLKEELTDSTMESDIEDDNYEPVAKIIVEGSQNTEGGKTVISDSPQDSVVTEQKEGIAVNEVWFQKVITADNEELYIVKPDAVVQLQLQLTELNQQNAQQAETIKTHTERLSEAEKKIVELESELQQAVPSTNITNLDEEELPSSSANFEAVPDYVPLFTTFHTVSLGEYLSKIATAHYGPNTGELGRLLCEVNREVIGSNCDLIYPGQSLYIPALSEIEQNHSSYLQFVPWYLLAHTLSSHKLIL